MNIQKIKSLTHAVEIRQMYKKKLDSAKYSRNRDEKVLLYSLRLRQLSRRINELLG